MAMQGVGAVIPIYAAFDERDAMGEIFFYDLLGATFESGGFCEVGFVHYPFYYGLMGGLRWPKWTSCRWLGKVLETAADGDHEGY